MKKTKIVATIGPATMSKEVLREMILAGLNVCRLNFSHGSYDDHAKAVEIIDFSWNLSDKEIEKIAYKHKLIAAKANLTKWQNKVDAFVKNWNLLFPYQEEQTYQAALARIERQKQKIQELEEINNQLKQ
jgi:hypothetical protein